MRIEAAKNLAQYRLFRPLGLQSHVYHRYSSDEALAQAIVKWTSNVLLGGRNYNLKIEPTDVFQTQSNLINRLVYIVPVWNGDLVREIVTCAKKGTKCVEERLKSECSDPESFLGGILVLKRYVFRGTKKYREGHSSRSGWFVEDRYHLDVFTGMPGDPDEEHGPDHTKSTPLLRVFRVFHDSVGCVEIPHWSLDSNVATQNASLAENTPEYYPPAEETVMSWHELAEHLKVSDTGIYALCNFLAAEAEAGRHYLVGPLALPYFEGEYTAEGSVHAVDLGATTAVLWSNPSQPLPKELSDSYERFIRTPPTDVMMVPVDSAGAGTAIVPPVHFEGEFVVDTYSTTQLFDSNLGIALVQFLLSSANGSARYLGNGLFRLKAKNATSLAAGTGNWGSAEYTGFGISTTADDDADEDVAGNGTVDGSGGTGLTVDLIRYTQKDKIAIELQACVDTGVSAACIECVKTSTAMDFHKLGTAADFIDIVAGIAACVVAFFGGPVVQGAVCGVTLPSAGGAAKDFWDDVTGAFDYAGDVCSGLPDVSPSREVYQRRCETAPPARLVLA